MGPVLHCVIMQTGLPFFISHQDKLVHWNKKKWFQPFGGLISKKRFLLFSLHSLQLQFDFLCSAHCLLMQSVIVLIGWYGFLFHWGGRGAQRVKSAFHGRCYYKKHLIGSIAALCLFLRLQGSLEWSQFAHNIHLHSKLEPLNVLLSIQR